MRATVRAVLRGVTLLACAQSVCGFAGGPGMGAVSRLASGRTRNLRTGAWVCAERGATTANQDRRDAKDRRSALQQFGGSVLAAAVAIGAPQIGFAEEEEEVIFNVGKREAVLDSGFTFDQIEKRFGQSTLRLDAGGILSQREPLVRNALAYPPWMVGEWDVVNCTVDTVTQPIQASFSAKSPEALRAVLSKVPFSPVGPHYETPNGSDAGRMLSGFKLRYVPKGLRAESDFAFNYQSQANAFSDMGVGIDLFETGSVKYSDKSKAVGGRFGSAAPAELRGMESFNRRVRAFGEDRCSLCQTFVGWEILDGGLIGEDGSLKALRRYEVIDRFHWEGGQSFATSLKVGDIVTNKKRVALYLVKGEDRADAACGYAVTLVDLSLTMKRTAVTRT